MMIPIPRRGIYHGAEGMAAAQPARHHRREHRGGTRGICPASGRVGLPGFIFARTESPADAEAALRRAHRRLRFDIRPEYPARETT